MPAFSWLLEPGLPRDTGIDYPVKVSTDGTSWITGTTITYARNPSILGVTPVEGSVLGNYNVTISGARFARNLGCTNPLTMSSGVSSAPLDDCLIVMFGNYKATVVAMNTTEIVVRLPSAAAAHLPIYDHLNISISVDGGKNYFMSLHHFSYIYVATLVSISIDGCVGGLTPAFDPYVFDYACSIMNNNAVTHCLARVC